MKPFLMGGETEYAVSGHGGDGRLAPREVHMLLLDAIRAERFSLEDVVGSQALYLENGARFYLDYGEHPEHATPECHDPRQVAAYDKAGEMLLDLARRRVHRARPGHRITILKNNLHTLYPDSVTWGAHESYTSWVQPETAAEALLPHLVSRTVYCGAGCLSAYAGGPGFELSQRARHVQHAVGNDTTSDRSLFCTRIRKQSDRNARGWMRAHLISKDSQRSPLGIYLTYGVTGLLFLMLNEGYKVGRGLRLADPVGALRAVSSDPWLKRKLILADGRRMTALDIQRQYLDEATQAVQGGDFPEWTGEVLEHWGQTLATLSSDPLKLADQLDPYYKLLVFDHELARAGVSWGELRQGLYLLGQVRAEHGGNVVQALLADSATGLTPEEKVELAQARTRLGEAPARTLERLRLTVRLQQFDVAYHEVGGMYDRMLADGLLRSAVLTPDEIEQATCQPPAGGRAAARGHCIKHFREPGWVCEWRYLYRHETDEFIDLRDPFASSFTPGTLARLTAEQPDDLDLMEICGQVGRR